jgi:ribulose-5-phosphate 4-epimerase/fuculose-1-phosphate aldolase
MLLESLREQEVQVGLEALARGIVHGTAGNMSIHDPKSGLIAISPSGMLYPL